MGETPQGLKGAWEKDEGVKGGEVHSHGKRGKTQTYGAGRRDEWRRLADGG